MLSIRTFGTLAVEWDSKALAGLHSGKFLELFCYLLLQRDDSTPARVGDIALGRFHYCALPESTCVRLCGSSKPIFCDAGSPNLLQVTRDSVRLNLQHEDWLDVAVFENAYLQVKCTPAAI
jgi:hypothetical protein